MLGGSGFVLILCLRAGLPTVRGSSRFPGLLGVCRPRHGGEGWCVREGGFVS